MDFWLAVMMEGTEHLLDIARAAEELGYAGIVLADHIAVPHGFASVHPSGENPFHERSAFPDPLTCIAAMATATTTLRFMPYVYVLPMREPFSVAKQAGTVAMLSQYRLALGVGAGWLREEIELLGVDPRTRGKRMDEMIAVMRQFWTTGTAELHGDHFDFGPTSMAPVPTGRIPIWVGGKSPAALARAARNDGWLGMDYDVEEIDGLLPQLADARRRHLDVGGDADAPFETLVIPRAMPERGLYASLQDKGVTSTVCVAWALGEVTDLSAKIDGMAAFAGAFIAPSAS